MGLLPACGDDGDGMPGLGQQARLVGQDGFHAADDWRR
jgi:hypothetical protein